MEPKQEQRQFVKELGADIKATQKFVADVLTEKPVYQYRVDDFPEIRRQLFNNVKNAVGKRFPLYNDRYSLSVEGLEYDGPEEIGIDEQKKAILNGKSVSRKLRGSWVLSDASGKVVARTKKMTLARVPYMTDRGTFIRNGHEYCFSNIMRLEPGVYVKERPDEVSAQFNIKQGTGGGFGMRMVPKTGVFEMTRGTSKAPAYTVLKDMGVTDDQMKATWGDALYSINRDAGMSTRARQQADRFYN